MRLKKLIKFTRLRKFMKLRRIRNVRMFPDSQDPLETLLPAKLTTHLEESSRDAALKSHHLCWGAVAMLW